MSRLELLGKNIKTYRKAKHLTQRDLAVALDCTYEFICHVEKGQMAMSLKRLFQLADILEVKMTDLIDFD
jgi:transcriptional regulator with XRE-family HTH domain